MASVIHNSFQSMPLGMLPEDPETDDLSEEAADAEAPEEGCLRGDGKQHTVLCEKQSSALMQKVFTSTSDCFQAKEQKTFDPKFSPSLNKSAVEKEMSPKEVKSFESPKNASQSGEKQALSKFLTTGENAARENIAAAIKSAFIPTSTGYLRFSTTSHKTIPASKEQTHVSEKRASSSNEEVHEKKTQQKHDRSDSHLQPPAQHRKEASQEPTMQKQQDYERQEEQKERRERQKDGEGNQEKNQDSSDHEDPSLRVEKTKAAASSKVLASHEELYRYGLEQSILSEIFQMRVSHFDVLILFIEILKIEIKSKEQERISRQNERELQLYHMQLVVENYKQAGRWMFMTSIGSGILGIASGALPIVGHVGGDWIMEKLSGVFSSLKSMEKDKLFDNLSKITFQMSEMYKNTGLIHDKFSEADRTYDQHMSDIHRIDHEEGTRTMEDIKDFWKNIENFLFEMLRMYHEAIRQLYNI